MINGWSIYLADLSPKPRGLPTFDFSDIAFSLHFSSSQSDLIILDLSKSASIWSGCRDPAFQEKYWTSTLHCHLDTTSFIPDPVEICIMRSDNAKLLFTNEDIIAENTNGGFEFRHYSECSGINTLTYSGSLQEGNNIMGVRVESQSHGEEKLVKCDFTLPSYSPEWHARCVIGASR